MDFSGFKEFGVYNDNEHEKLIKEYPSLYHYTTEKALDSILETKSLWATNCQGFDDKTETTHIIHIFEKIIKEQNGINAIRTKETMNSLIRNLETERDYIYVICFSKDKNTKAMWKHEKTVNDLNIEFDTPSIDKILSYSGQKLINAPETVYTKSIILNNVTYTNNDLENYIRKINDKFNNERSRNEPVTDENIHNLTNIFLLSLQLSVFTKGHNYIEQNEIRAAFVLLDKNNKQFEKYRDRDKEKISYLDISFENNGKLPIKSITINPDRSEKIKDIEDLLKSNNYDVPVILPKRK